MFYDLCDPKIRCNADKEGAAVFEVYCGGKLVRVLTFEAKRAGELAQSESLAAASALEDCGSLF